MPYQVTLDWGRLLGTLGRTPASDGDGGQVQERPPYVHSIESCQFLHDAPFSAEDADYQNQPMVPEFQSGRWGSLPPVIGHSIALTSRAAESHFSIAIAFLGAFGYLKLPS